MQTDCELMQQALDALLNAQEFVKDAFSSSNPYGEEIEALRARLAQPKSDMPPLPEAFDWHKQPMTGWYGKVYTEEQMLAYAEDAVKCVQGKSNADRVPLDHSGDNAEMVKKEWRSLSTAETKVLWNLTKKPREYAQAIEAKLKERNA